MTGVQTCALPIWIANPSYQIANPSNKIANPSNKIANPSYQEAKLDRVDGGYVLTAGLSDGNVVALLPTDDSAVVSGKGLSTTGAILVQRRAKDGTIIETLTVKE